MKLMTGVASDVMLLNIYLWDVAVNQCLLTVLLIYRLFLSICYSYSVLSVKMSTNNYIVTNRDTSKVSNSTGTNYP